MAKDCVASFSAITFSVPFSKETCGNSKVYIP